MATISGSRAASAGEVPKTSSSHPYTCNACQVAFRNSNLQKDHMRSDWHRYNLKRRVVSLPPITSEVFTDKVLQAREETTAEAKKAGFQKHCEWCQKTFYSDNSFQNHIGSSKHRARATSIVETISGTTTAKVDDEVSSLASSSFSLGKPVSRVDSLDSDAEDEFNEVVKGLAKTDLLDRPSPVRRPSYPHSSRHGDLEMNRGGTSTGTATTTATTTATMTANPSANAEAPKASLKMCLFCNYESPTPPLNVIHMERIHGTFIPEKGYLVNLEGLLGYLQKRVFDFHECIYCRRVKANVFAVQTHMRDKGHCDIPYTTQDEQLDIGEYYDFRSTYSDGGEDDDSMDEDKPIGGVKLGAKREAKVTAQDGDEVMEEDGWETDSSASSLDSDDLHFVPAENHYHQHERLDKHRHHSCESTRPHHQRDGWHAHNHKRAHAVFYDDYELHLPSGRSVGHRSLNRYYRQNLHSHPSPEERAERLAIEAANAEQAMDVDHDVQEVARQDDGTHHRALVNRETRGLANPNRKDAKKVVLKGRQKESLGQRHKDLGVSKQYFKEKHRNPVTYLR